MFPIDSIPLRLQSVIEQINDFGLQKQESWGWRLIYANYYLQYNLVGKFNLPFFSKINHFDGIINR